MIATGEMARDAPHEEVGNERDKRSRHGHTPVCVTPGRGVAVSESAHFCPMLT
jgi:hypothetical protein